MTVSIGGDIARRSLAPLEPLLQRLESASVLDPPAKAISKLVSRAIPTGTVKDAISGTWLGHALHPLLTDVVIGAWLSATALDVIGGEGDDQASRRLIGLGIAAYFPTALTGVNDWADTEPDSDAVRRTGLIHAVSNSVTLSLYTASLLARRRGARRQGALLSAAGATVLGAAAYLGGHLSLRKGVGADQTVFDPGPTEWTAAGDAAQLPDGRMTRVVAADTPVLIVRTADRVFAIHDRCSHRGCSLSDGELAGEEVVCPCHGSRFSLHDGALRHGPATAPQPAFEVRERDGRVEIRRVQPE